MKTIIVTDKLAENINRFRTSDEYNNEQRALLCDAFRTATETLMFGNQDGRYVQGVLLALSDLWDLYSEMTKTDEINDSQ